MQSKIKFHVDYEGQPTIDMVSVSNQEDQRDILVNLMMSNVKYPNGYNKKVPFDLPKGIFVVKELMPTNSTGECGSEMKPVGEKYTLIPLNRLEPQYVFRGNEIEKYTKYPENIEDAIEGVIEFYRYIGFTESKHVQFLAEYLSELITKKDF